MAGHYLRLRRRVEVIPPYDLTADQSRRFLVRDYVGVYHDMIDQRIIDVRVEMILDVVFPAAVFFLYIIGCRLLVVIEGLHRLFDPFLQGADKAYMEDVGHILRNKVRAPSHKDTIAYFGKAQYRRVCPFDKRPRRRVQADEFLKRVG